ncbi:DDE-type integrase/transposase/recombinase, partial [Streptomyces sp. 110]|nr:DDE-type integrase/transposase/recombinase [Streptomyces endocoffeicus]
MATVIDIASRRLAGWAIADHMRTDLVTDALAAAERTRGSLAGAVMHTDYGAQYTSRAFADACRQAGTRQSMSAIGSSADNALAESRLAAPLQHPTPSLPLRTTQSHRLRNSVPDNTNYAGPSRLARVQDSGSR